MRRSRKCKISLLSGLGTRVPFFDSHQEYLHPALPSNGSLPMVMSWPPDDMSKIILIPVHEHLGTSLAGALDRGVERNYFADMGCSRGERPACGRAQLRALKEGLLATCSLRRNWYRSLSTFRRLRKARCILDLPPPKKSKFS